MIKIFDDVFTVEENLSWHKSLMSSKKFRYGHSDKVGLPPTGLVFNLDEEQHEAFHKVVVEHFPLAETLKVERSYVNLFLPLERPYYHKDGNCITCLFYVNPEVDIDEGGETHFYMNDKILGVVAKPARLVVFDGNVLHRATSFRTTARISVALKYKV